MIALTGLMSIINSLAPFFATYWKYILAGCLALGLVFTTHEWQHTSGLLKTEKATYNTLVTNVTAASKLAQQKADAEKAQLQQQNVQKASDADANYTNLLTTYHALLLRNEATQGVRSGPSGGQSNSPAKGVDGSGQGPIIPPITTFTMTDNDANICVENTARLQAAHTWALSLEPANGK